MLELLPFIIVGIFMFILYYGREYNKKSEAEMKRVETLEHEKKHSEFIQAATDRIHSLITQHIRTLSLKHDQNVTKDDYGNYIFDKWFQEIDYFIDNVLRKDDLISSYLMDSFIETLHSAGVSTMDDVRIERLEEIHNLISEAVDAYKADRLENHDNPSIDIDSLDPIQFEFYCVDILRNNGWDARTTQASGDQGIDIIATRDNVKAVLQCKKYSQPVGNSAVQEVIAGKQFEQADIAAVVSNNSYTQSAKQLAKAAGVYLLHYTELDKLVENR